MPETASRRVLDATWNRHAGPHAGSGGDIAELRRGALTQALVMVLVAGGLHLGLGHHIPALIVLILAAVVLLVGLVLTPAYRPIHRFGRRLALVVGATISHLVLVPFFYLFFTPVALILRAQGRDPLHRRFRDPQWTYWIRRSAKDRSENIDKQFLREEKDARGEFRTVGPDAPTDRPGPQ